MADLRDLIASGGPVIADGAWGTQLKEKGLSGCPELWNDQNPEAVLQVARSYVDAGAQVILTNSFGGSPFKLAGWGLEDRTEELNEKAARLSREAAGGSVVVLGSVGPTGKFLQPYGPVKPEEMEKGFLRQITGLLRGGADGIVIETMSDIGEAECALRAARSAGAPYVVVSMTFERKKAGMVTMMGVKPEEAARHFTERDCLCVGANCGTGVDDMVEVISAMARATSAALWAKPNAGIPRVVEGKTVYPEGPEEMARKIQRLRDAGATVVGGCCGTTPEHIRRIAELLH